MAIRLPRLGRARDAWPGVVISGIVIVAAAILADAFGEPPRGGARLAVGVTLGLVLIALGYLLRFWENRIP